MERLHPDTLDLLDPAIARPAYDVGTVRPGIVHLGLGAFHRAHMAMYTDKAIAVSGGSWRIIGVSMRSDAVARQLRPQGCLYSVMSEDAQGAQVRVIGALSNVLVAPENPGAVADAIADSAIHIVSLTITEKGYALAADGRTLDAYDEAVAADLANPENPCSAIGLLALGLIRRHAAGGAPLTVMSCDNLIGNSRLLQSVLAQYLGKVAPDILPWLDSDVAFPCTMVDRIVPAATDAQRERQEARLGLCDAAAVCTEPFHQWFIENDFATPRPDWEAAGAQVVFDVAPYERIKLGLLNAAHSAIAQFGQLAGLETVDQVMAQPRWREQIETLMDEDLIPALDQPAGFDMAHYRRALLERFSNPVLGHRCAQIAQDSSDKIAQRWLPVLARSDAPEVTRALAAWVYVVLFTQLPLDDARAATLNALRTKPGALALRIANVLETARITSTSVYNFRGCCEAVAHWVEQLQSGGAEALLQTRNNQAS